MAVSAPSSEPDFSSEVANLSILANEVKLAVAPCRRGAARLTLFYAHRARVATHGR